MPDEQTPEPEGAAPSWSPFRATAASVDGTLADSGMRPLAPDGPPAPAKSEESRSPLRVIARGFTWVTASQVLTAGGNLVLTPFVIHGLGIERYGMFVLAFTITSFLSSFNGGLGSTANRYFPIYAGADDRVATTRLLLTLLVFVVLFGCVAGTVDWFVSPLIVRSLSLSPSLRPESIYFLRTLGVLITFGFAHNVVAAVMVARQRFDRAIQAGLACYVIWVVGLVWAVHYHKGLKGVALVFVVQQVATVAIIAPTAMRYLSRKGVGLLPWSETRQLLGFSSRMQVAGFANLINVQLDTVIVGTALSVRTVGIYNSGNSFAAQLSSVAQNALGPASVQLGNTYGKGGPEGAFQQYVTLQHRWVVAVTGWSAVGMAAAYFGVTSWLGRQFDLGGWVAVASVGGGMFPLVAGMQNIYITTMRRAELEMRYGLVSMVFNIVLIAPLAFIGALPVAIGAGAAQALSTVYLLRLARRRIRPDIPNFFRQMPVLRALLAALVTVVLELVVHPHVRTGPIGLLECVPAAALGLAVYASTVLGPRRIGSTLSLWWRGKGGAHRITQS
ncbi:MAG: lipopolysaccharide biosynthesis protein [Acidimicrobiales bacterium]